MELKKKCKINLFCNVDNVDSLEQQLYQIIENNINFGPTLEVIHLKIYDLFKWQQDGEIPKEIPFKMKYQNNTCQDKILLIKFHRNPNRICDLKDDFTFQNKYDKRVSWIRIARMGV